jgi:hypothetical protein
MAAKKAIGACAALGVFLAGASISEAQVGSDPTGPWAICGGQTSCTVTATVTASATFYFWVRVWQNGNIRHDGKTYYYLPSGGTVNAQRFVDMSGWNVVVGDQLRFWTRPYLALNFFVYDLDEWYVTASDCGGGGGGGTFIMPDRDRVRERTGVDLA